VWCGMIGCAVMCCDVLWCDVMWCDVMWCDVLSSLWMIRMWTNVIVDISTTSSFIKMSHTTITPQSQSHQRKEKKRKENWYCSVSSVYRKWWRNTIWERGEGRLLLCLPLILHCSFDSSSGLLESVWKSVCSLYGG